MTNLPEVSVRALESSTDDEARRRVQEARAGLDAALKDIDRAIGVLVDVRGTGGVQIALMTAAHLLLAEEAALDRRLRGRLALREDAVAPPSPEVR